MPKAISVANVNGMAQAMYTLRAVHGGAVSPSHISSEPTPMPSARLQNSRSPALEAMAGTNAAATTPRANSRRLVTRTRKSQDYIKSANLIVASTAPSVV